MDNHVPEGVDLTTYDFFGIENAATQLADTEQEEFPCLAQDPPFLTSDWHSQPGEVFAPPSSNNDILESPFNIDQDFAQPFGAQVYSAPDLAFGDQALNFTGATYMSSYNTPNDYTGHNLIQESPTDVNAMFDMYIDPSSFLPEPATEQVSPPEVWVTSPDVEATEFVVSQAHEDATSDSEWRPAFEAPELAMPHITRNITPSAGTQTDIDTPVIDAPELNAAEANVPDSQAQELHAISAPDIAMPYTPMSITSSPTALPDSAHPREDGFRFRNRTAATDESGKPAHYSVLHAPLKWFTYGVEAYDGTGISYEDIVAASRIQDARSQVGKGRSALKLYHDAGIKAEWIGLTNKQILNRIKPDELTGKLILHLAQSMSNEALTEVLNKLLVQNGKKEVGDKIINKRIQSAREAQEDPEAEREKIHRARTERGIPSVLKSKDELAEMAEKRRKTKQSKSNTTQPSVSSKEGVNEASEAATCASSGKKKRARSSSTTDSAAPAKKKRRSRKDILEMGLTNFPNDGEGTGNTDMAQSADSELQWI